MAASSYVGRFHRVRGLAVADGAYSRPLVLDRRSGGLSPYTQTGEWPRRLRIRGRDWIEMPDGSVRPAIAGGAFSGLHQANPSVLALYLVDQGMATGAQATLALDSAYTFNSAGDVLAFRLYGTGKTLAKVYVYLTGFTGTAANVNDLNFEFRNDSGGVAPNRAAPTLHTSATVDPASTTGWLQFNPADFATVLGTVYWACLGDADGNGTDFATLLSNLSYANTSPITHIGCYDATNGASTNPTNRNRAGVLVLEWTDGTVYGWSAATYATPTADGYHKGLYLGSLMAPLTLWGAYQGNTGTMTGLEVYASATPPGGTTLASGSAIIYGGSGTALGAFLSGPAVLAAGTPYRVVFTQTSTGGPKKLALGTANGYETTLRQARMGGAGWYYAWANGTTDWANDDQDAQPHMGLLIEDQVNPVQPTYVLGLT